MHDVTCEFVRAAVCSKDAQKQLAQASLKRRKNRSILEGCRVFALALPPSSALLLAEKKLTICLTLRNVK